MRSITVPKKHAVDMQFLLSPWFIGLNIASFIVMGFELWGWIRACKRHNESAMGTLCGEDSHLPTMGAVIVTIIYISLTLAYIFVPPLIHDIV